MNLRKYGNEPFDIAVIHGGPGAPGGVAPIARELSKVYGVLEPLQSENSIDGQINELKNQLKNNASFPVVLIGHSWGAWLSYIFAARFPHLVKMIILVGSGSYEEEYLSSMNSKRISRLSEEENSRVSVLMNILNDSSHHDRKDALSEFGKLMSKADSYDPIYLEDEAIDFHPNVFKRCMNELNRLRSSKKLLDIGNDIECPVIAVHGEYDSHPYEGVKEPLTKVIKDFKFLLLKDCGHYPWNEAKAKEEFYNILHHSLDIK